MTNIKWTSTAAELSAAPANFHMLYKTLTKIHELLNDYAILVTDRERLLDLMINKQIKIIWKYLTNGSLNILSQISFDSLIL